MTRSWQHDYLGFAGEKSTFGLNAGLKIGDFKDGTFNTLLVVETKATVPWTKPEDLKFNMPEDARRAKPLQDRILRIVHADGSSRTIDAANSQLAQLVWRSRPGRPTGTELIPKSLMKPGVDDWRRWFVHNVQMY